MVLLSKPQDQLNIFSPEKHKYELALETLWNWFRLAMLSESSAGQVVI